ncbi:MAG: hypothetical protein IJU48_09990 [Synergistaceae bacterium]|nr:hypothetical protein [Synergistaceae bacterium]
MQKYSNGEFSTGEFSTGTWFVDWETGYVKAVDFDHREPLENPVAEVYIHDLMGRPDDMDIANARLIAVSPDMYDGLYDAMLLMKSKIREDGDEFSKQVKSIQDLLDRIDGKEVQA